MTELKSKKKTSDIINIALTIMLLIAIGYMIYSGAYIENKCEPICKEIIIEKIDRIQFGQAGILYDCKLNGTGIYNG